MEIDCILSTRGGLPVDRAGHRVSESGRWLIAQAVSAVYGLAVGPADVVRDEHRRWSLPDYELRASVAHCAGIAAVTLSHGPYVGVDVQDERERPLAMAWLGELLGRPAGEPATIRDFAECESLIKASHLTKETFAGVRLPRWRPGWRPGNTGYQFRSTRIGSEVGVAVHLALSASRPVPVRWWGHDRGSAALWPTAEPGTWDATADDRGRAAA